MFCVIRICQANFKQKISSRALTLEALEGRDEDLDTQPQDWV